MATYDKEYIVRYIDGELTADERQEFEAELRRNPALTAEISLYRELKETLGQRLKPDEHRDALRARLAILGKSHFDRVIPLAPRGARRISLNRWLAGMTAAASLIVATLLLWPSGKGDLIDKLGHTEMIGTAERGGQADSLLQQAATYFNRQEFSKALPLLDRAVKADSSDQLALFYRGIAAWHMGSTGSARQDLQHIYSSESLLRYEAAFYMALTYAAEKKNATAREWLEKIPEGTPVTKKAKELNAGLK
ncbi:MAG: hypothetical protein Q8927_20545 [Bacteroidota bacterium]|nr:hypothetical protein [Bacteroidota bacterium]MDP4218595.1 hypothetical protein [Bacteroidota bacterium]MDP4244869.1 hypothetical protein [Bacteroidota bacterium]MDP4253642.1 hypothetical protein [Bacteroidota bacterium]MDP4260474.1 hypothetical protein [Bacteroidota bacterium]